MDEQIKIIIRQDIIRIKDAIKQLEGYLELI